MKAAQPLRGARLSSAEIGNDRRLGERTPLPDALDLIADYLDGLHHALQPHITANHPLELHASVLPAWAAFLRGQHARSQALTLETERPA